MSIQNRSGQTLEDDEAIRKEAVDFFSSLFAPKLQGQSSNSFMPIKTFSKEKANALIENVTIEEIKLTFMSLNGEKSSGLDGFIAKMFSSYMGDCWR